MLLCMVINNVYSQTCSIYDQGLTVFPASDIPADTVTLEAHRNDFMTFPVDAFDHLYQLEILNLGQNPFTVFPDITSVGGTLKLLSVSECEVPVIDSWIFDELVVLEELFLNSWVTIEIPNVLGPANTFEDISWRYYSGTSFPILSQYKALKRLDLSWSYITTIKPGDFIGLDSLETLFLYNAVPIVPTPDFSSISDTLSYLNIKLGQVPLFKPEEAMMMTKMKELHLSLDPAQVSV